MAAWCETQEELQLSGFVHSMTFCKETHDEDASSVESPETSPDTSSVETSDTSSVETPAMSSVESQEELELSGVAHSMAYCKETHDEETSLIETSDTSPVETPEASSVETPAMSSVESQEELELSGVAHGMAFYTETHDEETSLIETSDTSPVETTETSSVETPAMSSVESQEELELSGVAHSMAYCKKTHSLLICDCFSFTIEQFSHSSSSGLTLQPQKLLKLYEQYGISCPISVQIASKMESIFIGCESKIGIYVLDQNSLQLVKKFAQNMNRDFDYMVVDETEYPQCCTVYASSVNNDILTKFDYNSGLVTRELPVMTPSNILLKDDKLYLICGIDSSECVVVIDKHSLNIQSKFSLSGWSLLGGLCLDERGDVFVTASNDSNHRIIYSLDDGGKVVGRVLLKEFHRHAHALDMVAADKDFIILAQEPEEDFTLKRIQFTF